MTEGEFEVLKAAAEIANSTLFDRALLLDRLRQVAKCGYEKTNLTQKQFQCLLGIKRKAEVEKLLARLEEGR